MKPPTDEATRALSAAHRPVTANQYGAYIVAGFAVAAGISGKVRVTHATPNPDLCDPDRPSDDEMAAARHRMVNAYAATLDAAGWVVEKRAPRSRYPYLLAGRA